MTDPKPLTTLVEALAQNVTTEIAGALSYSKPNCFATLSLKRLASVRLWD